MSDLPPTAPPAGMGQQPHRGTTVLVLGIIGIVICPICGIIAWVMGSGDVKQMKAGTMDATGLPTTNAGKICGMIAVGLWLLWILAYVGCIVLGVAAGVAGAGAGA